MANTYTQLYIHYVFAVWNRLSMINHEWESELYKYITGVVNEQGHKLYAINGVADHIHVLVSMSPKQAPSDLMYHVKRCSSLWVNKNRLARGKFFWQEGFGAFSYGKSQIPMIANYIGKQKQHHKKQTFFKEYVGFLDAYGIEYDEKYLYKPLDGC